MTPRPTDGDAGLVERLRDACVIDEHYGPALRMSLSHDDVASAATRIEALSAEVERMRRERDNLTDVISGIGKQCASVVATAIRSSKEG